MTIKTDNNRTLLIGKKALSAVLAAASCLYLSAGIMPYGYVYADEVPAAVEQEENGGDKPKQEKTPETPSKENNTKSETPAKENDTKSETPEEPEKKTEEKAPAEKEPEEKQPEENKPEENKPDENKPEENKPEEKTPAEGGNENQNDDPAGSEGNQSGDPETPPKDTPSDTPSESVPAETPSENPAEDPSGSTPADTPEEQPQNTEETPEEPVKEIKYRLSGKGYLPKNKGKGGTFSNGVLTIGKRGKRLEAFKISLVNSTGYSGTINYRAYVRKKGWTKWAGSGKKIGTKKKNLRIEAVQIRLTGELAKHYYVEYKATLSKLGDSQGWVRNNEIAGTRKDSRRIEVLQVRLVPIDENQTSSVIYRLYGQTYGWQKYWKKDGKVSGTFSKRVEGITIALGPSKYPGSITYRTVLQGGKWTGWVSGGSISGKKKGKRIEALQIKLTGEMAEHYDVYYRLYVQSFGWLAWAMNGQMAGTTGTSRRIEKVQILLREKDSEKPGDEEGIISVKPHTYYSPSNTNAIMTYGNILGAGYTDPDVFRKKLITNFEYMKDVGYFHMGKMVQGYTDCAGSVSLSFRVALKTAKFTKKYKKGTRTSGADKYGAQLYGIGVNYCGIKSYKDKYGWCRNGTASVNSHFLNTIVKKRKIKYSHVLLTDRNDGVPGWSNAEWVDYLKQVNAKPGDVFVWFNHDWSSKKGQHMTMFAGIGDDGIAYEWTASSTYGVIKSPLTDRSPQNIFESFALLKGVADLKGYN